MKRQKLELTLQMDSEKISEDLAIDVLLEFRYPADLKLAWLNPAEPKEFRCLGRHLDVGIGGGQFNEKIGLFLSIKTLFSLAGREKVTIWTIVFDYSIMCRLERNFFL